MPSFGLPFSDGDDGRAVKLDIKSASRIALVILAVAVIWTGWDWWLRRDTERVVTRWVIDAEQCARNANYEEARLTLKWLMSRYPESSQMGRVYYAMGLLYLEKYGDLAQAKSYFSSQIKDYPFNRQTIASYDKLSYINRMSDPGADYSGKPYLAYVMARRVLASGRIDEGARDLMKVVEMYPESAVIPEVLLTLGDYYLRDGNKPSTARLYYGMLRQRYPDSEESHKIPPPDQLNRPDPDPSRLPLPMHS